MTSPQPDPQQPTRAPNPTTHPEPSHPVAPPRPTKSRPRAGDLTPEQRSLRSRLGAHVRWANCEDRAAATAPARAAFNDRWEKQVDPEGVLNPHERSVRAAHAKSAHFARMAMASAKARAARKQKRKAA